MTRWNNLDNTLNRFVEEGTLAGCGLHIFRDGQLIYNHCVGSATADGTRPFTQDTRLRLHSMSKTFTCAGLMTLYDKGMFSLNDPVAEYLPEFSSPVVCVSGTDISDVVPAKTPITIRHLLSMTSGIPYWKFPFEMDAGPIQKDISASIKTMEQDAQQGKPCELADLVKIIAQKPLCFHPGEHWMYGLSHTVVGRLIEVLSGKRLSTYLREAVWEPLGLTRTCFVQQIPAGEEIAELMVSRELSQIMGLRAEEFESSALKMDAIGSRSDLLPGTNLGVELPCGGMSSTLEEMGRFFAMFANGGVWNGTRILGTKTIDLMRTNQLGPELLPEFTQMINRGFGYGLGTAPCAARQRQGSTCRREPSAGMVPAETLA